MQSEHTGKPRVAQPQRKQAVIRFEMPEDTLQASHPARVLWDVVGTLELSAFLIGAKAVEGTSGRATLSPRMKLTLWLYAISQGVGSAREIARLSVTDAAYRWIVGDLEVSHHTLSAFRVGHAEALDTLMTDILASLMHKGVLSLQRVAQDGMRVRAWASAPSFRSYGSLLACREQAALHLKAVLAAADDPETSTAQKAAREAAARDFQRRVEEAITTVMDLQKSRPADKPARASTTDPEARVMKMADGGFRPAYNVRMATAGSQMGGPRTIVGVQVTNVGSDMGSIRPMLDEIEERVGQLPATLLADANHAAHECIRDAKRRGVQALVAVPERSKNSGPNAANEAAISEWRNRMHTEDAQDLYRARAGLCELMNAHLRSHHGVNQFLVRGLGKVTCVALLAAVASNLLQHAPTLLT
jgi:transposase